MDVYHSTAAPQQQEENVRLIIISDFDVKF